MTNGKIQKKVLKKLSAVRAVLSRQEREILDAIVLGEAKAHVIAPNKTSRAATKSSGKNTSQAKAREEMSKNDEVKAHTLHQTGKHAGKADQAGATVAHKLHQTSKHAGKADQAGATVAHKLRSTRKQAGKAIVNQVKGKKAEVDAHLFGLGDQITPKTVPPTSLTPIEFDPNKEEYHPAEE